jgi:hypothetical protein
MLAGSHNELQALNSPGNMKEGVRNGEVNMLEPAEPDIISILREPKMNKWLVVDVNIDLKSVWEAMMGVVFVAPPS